MYNVSTEFKNKIKQNSRRIAGKLLLGNLELTPEDIISMNMEYSLGNDGIPAIGGVVASKLEVKLFRDRLPPVLTTQELKPYLGIEVSPGAIEYVPIGVFRISPKDTKKTDKTISLVGYDILFILENSPYNSNLKFPNTFNNIKTELETKGLKFASQTLTNVTIKEKPKTIRELLSDISELLGMNVVTNKLGQIEFRQLNVVEFDLDANNYYDFKLLADDDVKLTRLTVEKEGEENKDLTYGDDTGYTIKIKNDSINTQSELRTAYDRVFPLSYTAYECNMQGMPHVEVGDIMSLTDRHGIKRNLPVVYHRISYSGGLRSEIKANAPSGAISSTGSTGSNSITQSLNDLRVNILEVNTVLADKVSTNVLDANVARIEKIINTNLESINARIKIIETEDLTAINADITALKGNVAEIDTILSKEIFTELASVGQIVAGSGIIADGAIGDAQISSLSADKLDAGEVRTALVDIIGPDGRLKLSGNKLQIFDDDGLGTLYERIFLGVDDENNANLTLRGADGQTVLLTQDGLTDVGFTDGYNKLDDNSLDPKKIDIQKVVTRINEGTETIQASKIIIDNTTLDLSFNTIKNTVTSQGEEISNQRSEINALDDAIKLKVDNRTFSQYKTVTDENITTINARLSKNTSSINVLQEEINFKVSQTDIEKLINNIEIGGRNLLKNSSEKVDSSEYLLNTYYLTEPIIEGETYTISIKGQLGEGKASFAIYNSSGMGPAKQTALAEVHKNSDGVYMQTFKGRVPDGITNDHIRVYHLYKDTVVNSQIEWIKLEKGNKATDWTPAPEDIESEITAINTKVAGIDINLERITSRVSGTEFNITKVNDEIASMETRVSTAEQKITDSAIVDTVRSSTAYKGDLNTITNQVTTVEQLANQLEINVKDYTDGKLSGSTYTFDGNYATFKGAGLIIQNKLGQNVLQGDTNGDLQLTGDFTTYRGNNKALEMQRNSLLLYDWQGSKRVEPVGRIFTSRRNLSEDLPGVTLANDKNSHLTISYAKEGDEYPYYSYIDFDKDGVLPSADPRYSVTFWQGTRFKHDVLNEHILYFGSRNKMFESSSNSLVLEVNDGSVERGLTVQGDTSGRVLEFQPWHKQEIILWRNTKVNKDFLVAGSKNAVVKTANYGERLLNALETAEYYFADFGFGKISKDGECYIYIGDIFNETVNTEVEYHVIYGKYGEDENSKITTKERHANYFIAKGTPELEFSWFLVVKRKGYEYHRLEQPDNLDLERDDSVSFDRDFEQEDKKDKELEKIYDDKLNFDLVNLLLKEVV